MPDWQQIKERLTDLRIREALNNNPNIVAIVAVVVIAVSVLFVFMRSGGDESQADQNRLAYYYDTVTKELFTADEDLVPPFERENGNIAVRARVYSCGDCADEDSRFVAVYEKFTPEAIERSEAQKRGEPLPGFPPGTAMKSPRLYSFDGKKWFSPDDEGADAEIRERFTCDDGSQAQHCWPQ